MTLPVSVVALAGALVITAASVGVQRVVGFGFGVLSVPLLSLIDPDLAPVPQLLMTLPMTLAMTWGERGDLDLGGFGWVIAGRIPGALLGLLLLRIATDRTLDVLIGGAVLCAVALLASGLKVRRTPATQVTAGVASGTSGLVASIGGPPLALLYSEERSATARSTLAAIFSFGLTITIVARALAGEITRDDIVLSVVLFPALVVGYAVGARFTSLVEGGRLRTAMLALSALAALALLTRAIAG